MSKLQQTFTEILKKKKRVIGVTQQSLTRWQAGATSPSIKLMEKVCIDNEIELPFFLMVKLKALLISISKSG